MVIIPVGCFQPMGITDDNINLPQLHVDDNILSIHDLSPRGGGAHKHFFDRDACPRTNFKYSKK